MCVVCGNVQRAGAVKDGRFVSVNGVAVGGKMDIIAQLKVRLVQ